jgi:glycosyltransferase involved in cell wall biosynthesis
MIDILAYPRYPMRLTELVTPLKPLEAMAMGKTLVASDVGGHKELIRNNETGILFKAGDLEELTTSLNRILEDTKLRSQLEEQGREWVRDNKTWDKTTEVYKDIYRSVLKRRR